MLPLFLNRLTLAKLSDQCYKNIHKTSFSFTLVFVRLNHLNVLNGASDTHIMFFAVFSDHESHLPLHDRGPDQTLRGGFPGIELISVPLSFTFPRRDSEIWTLTPACVRSSCCVLLYQTRRTAVWEKNIISGAMFVCVFVCLQGCLHVCVFVTNLDGAVHLLTRYCEVLKYLLFVLVVCLLRMF